MKYFFEIQLPHAPACGWLRSPHGRDTWDKAFNEGALYLTNMQEYGKMTCGLRVACVEE